jgi:hypothetical protein
VRPAIKVASAFANSSTKASKTKVAVAKRDRARLVFPASNKKR